MIRLDLGLLQSCDVIFEQPPTDALIYSANLWIVLNSKNDEKSQSQMLKSSQRSCGDSCHFVCGT